MAPRNEVIWFKRKFEFKYKPEMYAIVLDRLRGTPARLEEKVRGADEAKLIVNPDGWSVKNQIGHLIFVEKLWELRLEDFREGRETLFAADVKNTKSSETDHNGIPIEKLLDDFRTRRAEIMKLFERFTVEDAAKTALHPRLNVPIRLVDHAEFAAEHDDHHLSRIHDLIYG